MIKLNLKTETEEQEIIKQYLEGNASETLAEKINNGVRIIKENKTLINKKDLNGFWQFASQEAQKLASKVAKFKAVKDDTVFGWAIHYFEEDSIEGTLFNEDGTEFKPAIKETPKTNVTIPKPVEKKENKQASLFDLFTTESNTKEEIDLKETTDDEEEIEEQEEHLSYKAELAKHSQPDPLEGYEIEENEIDTEQKEIQVIENENARLTLDKDTGEVLTIVQIEKSFDKKSLFILMNFIPELEMR